MSDNTEVLEPQLPSAGELLKQARERAGLTQQQVASKLNLRLHNITSIETDRLDTSISITFSKGYYKIYAKLVDVPLEQVMQAFERQHQQTAPQQAKLTSFSRRVAKQANDDRLMLFTYIVAFVLVALVVWWWWQQSEQSSLLSTTEAQTPLAQQELATIVSDDSNLSGQQSTSDQSEVVNRLSNPEPLVAAEQHAQDVLEVVNSGSDLALNNPQTDEQPAELDQDASRVADNVLQPNLESIETPVEPGTVEQTPARVELVFEFAKNCWVNIVDGSGERIAYGVKKAGRVMPVSGVPPFEVTLGEPSVVQIRYDDQPVMLSRFPAGQSVKFSLPLSPP